MRSPMESLCCSILLHAHIICRHEVPAMCGERPAFAVSKPPLTPDLGRHRPEPQASGSSEERSAVQCQAAEPALLLRPAAPGGLCPAAGVQPCSGLSLRPAGPLRLVRCATSAGGCQGTGVYPGSGLDKGLASAHGGTWAGAVWGHSLWAVLGSGAAAALGLAEGFCTMHMLISMSMLRH